MRARLLISLFVVASALLAAGSEEPLETLKQRAATANEGERPRLFLEIAERQLRAADAAYSQGSVDQGKAAVTEVADYCEKAAAAAASSRKHLKHTEIKIRDLSRRLGGMLRSVSFDDREPLQAALDRMEKARSGLLTAMFGLKS
jgi:hypothetical protein